MQTKPLIITITHDDIIRGVINSPTADFLARAAQRAGLQAPACYNGRVLNFQEVVQRDAAGKPLLIELRHAVLPLPGVMLIKELAYQDRFNAVNTLTEPRGQAIKLPITLDLGHPVTYKKVQA